MFPYEPEIQILGINPKDTKSLIPKHLHTFVMPLQYKKASELQHLMNNPNVHQHDWTQNLWHINNKTLLSHKKINESLQFAATWKELKVMVLSEISHWEKNKFQMIHLCYTEKEIDNIEFGL